MQLKQGYTILLMAARRLDVATGGRLLLKLQLLKVRCCEKQQRNFTFLNQCKSVQF
jgi:hypothetical protein